jgi:hypothetical protein
MTPTNFRTPRTDRLLRVTFRNGEVSRHEYVVSQLRWSDTGHDYDITHVAFGERA